MYINFEKFNEAIKLSDAKKYTKLWNDSGMRKYLDYEFDGSYRIYLPLNIDKNNIKYHAPLKNQIENILNQNDYEIVDYITNLCRKNREKNLIKITKILNKLKREDLAIEYNQEFEHFGIDSNNIVVISRHPIDIAGMSTDRGWTSCMNLDDGYFKSKIDKDVMYGTIIAYLIKNDDKNIQKPLSRILLKPHLDDYNYVWLLPDALYGTPSEAFKNTIDAWLDDIQGKMPDGVYSIKRGLHTDITNNRNVIKDPIKYLEHITKYSQDEFEYVKKLKISFAREMLELPREISLFKNLTELSIDETPMRKLPKELFDMINLKHLSLNNNNLNKIPADIKKLINLEVLELNGNSLTQLPKELFTLTKLNTLNLSRNEITKSLKILKISVNALTVIPKEISELKNLEQLYISENDIDEIPQFLFDMKLKIFIK
jgi:hypothetical protein